MGKMAGEKEFDCNRVLLQIFHHCGSVGRLSLRRVAQPMVAVHSDTLKTL